MYINESSLALSSGPSLEAETTRQLLPLQGGGDPVTSFEKFREEVRLATEQLGLPWKVRPVAEKSHVSPPQMRQKLFDILLGRHGSAESAALPGARRQPDELFHGRQTASCNLTGGNVCLAEGSTRGQRIGYAIQLSDLTRLDGADVCGDPMHWCRGETPASPGLSVAGIFRQMGIATSGEPARLIAAA